MQKYKKTLASEGLKGKIQRYIEKIAMERKISEPQS